MRSVNSLGCATAVCLLCLGPIALQAQSSRQTTDDVMVRRLISLPFDSVSSVTARLPALLASLGSLWLTFRLGRRLYNDRVATYAGFLLVVTYVFWDKARSAQTDAVLSFFILVSLSAFEAFRSKQSDARRAGLLFWTAAALAVLTKG